MSQVRIITDSASDLSSDREGLLRVIPLKVTFGDTEYRDCVDLTFDKFYENLIESDELPKTSQATPIQFEEEFEDAAKDGMDVVAITLSSKLSGTYQSACIAAQEFDNVYVVDSENVTVGQRALVQYALELARKGLGAGEIADILNRDKKKIRLVALLDTLEYLKKGGRISATAAAIGSLLSIKPVIAVVDGELQVLGKARGSKQGNNLLVQQIEATGGIDFTKPFFLGYTGVSDVTINKYIEDSRSLWEKNTTELPVTRVGAAVGTHIGPGGIAVAFFSIN